MNTTLTETDVEQEWSEVRTPDPHLSGLISQILKISDSLTGFRRRNSEFGLEVESNDGLRGYVLGGCLFNAISIKEVAMSLYKLRGREILKVSNGDLRTYEGFAWRQH
jgi:hypothetical protein